MDRGRELRIQGVNYWFAHGQKGPEKEKGWDLGDSFTETMVHAQTLIRTERFEMGRKSARRFKEMHKPSLQTSAQTVLCGLFPPRGAGQWLPRDGSCGPQATCSPALEGSFRPCPAVMEVPP